TTPASRGRVCRVARRRSLRRCTVPSQTPGDPRGRRSRRACRDRASLPACGPAMQDDDLSNEALQAVGKELEVILSLGQHDRRTALLDRLDHVVLDLVVPGFIGGERAIDVLDA